MFYRRDDTYHGVTLFTGPNYVTLHLALVDAERHPDPDVVQVEDPRCPDIDPHDVRAAVLKGVDEVNARHGTRWHPVEIKFVMERPSLPLLCRAAVEIVERLVTAGDAGYVPAVPETRRTPS